MGGQTCTHLRRYVGRVLRVEIGVYEEVLGGPGGYLARVDVPF